LAQASASIATTSDSGAIRACIFRPGLSLEIGPKVFSFSNRPVSFPGIRATGRIGAWAALF
jgi:hypothetical protein